MAEEPHSSKIESIQTEGGSVVSGNVQTGRDFIAGAQTTLGDQVQGNKIEIHYTDRGLLLGWEREKVLHYEFLSAKHLQDRRDLKNRVRFRRISILERGFSEFVRLELQLKETPDALARRIQVWEGGTSEGQLLPVDTPLVGEFIKSGRSLLILGNPGAGKTFALLELCRDLLQAAENDDTLPVPVVINLSSWAKHRQPLGSWLEERLWREYEMARPIMQAWIRTNQLCLLLDGLDEVAKSAWELCVKAINDFREMHQCPVVICSRTDAYTDLTNRLNIGQAITILPLSDERVKEFLLSPDLNLVSIHSQWSRDEDLRELLRTPLMLNIISLAYRDNPNAFVNEDTEWQTTIFDAYIKRMFRHRRPVKVKFSPAQELTYLRFIAKRLKASSETDFYLEDISPSWVSRRGQLAYKGFITSIIVGAWLLVANLGYVSIFGELGLDDEFLGKLLSIGMFLGFGYLALITTLNLQELLPGSKDYHPKIDRDRSLKAAEKLLAQLGLRFFLGLVGVSLWVGSELIKEYATTPSSFLNIWSLLIGLFTLLIIIYVIACLFSVAFGILGVLFAEAHYFLRILLRIEGSLPFNLPEFLDSMAERMILQKIEPGHRFLHDLFKNYFAHLGDEDINRIATDSEKYWS